MKTRHIKKIEMSRLQLVLFAQTRNKHKRSYKVETDTWRCNSATFNYTKAFPKRKWNNNINGNRTMASIRKSHRPIKPRSMILSLCWLHDNERIIMSIKLMTTNAATIIDAIGTREDIKNTYTIFIGCIQ